VGTAHNYSKDEETILLKRNFISAVTVYRLFVKTFYVHLKGLAVDLSAVYCSETSETIYRLAQHNAQ